MVLRDRQGFKMSKYAYEVKKASGLRALHDHVLVSDMHFGEMLIPYMIESIKAIPNKNFIITPQITKRWDSSWDILVNENFKPIPYFNCFDLNCHDIDLINSSTSPSEFSCLAIFSKAIYSSHLGKSRALR